MQAKLFHRIKHVLDSLSLEKGAAQRERRPRLSFSQTDSTWSFDVVYGLDKRWYMIKVIVITAQFANLITYSKWAVAW